MLNHTQVVQKRIFDITLAIFGILLGWWIILITWIIASLETRSNGLFQQKRIGRDGKPFFVWKIKTMYPSSEIVSTVTTSNDQRITKSGRFFRQTKIDELPQLFNVLFGTMSFVGPRPDVPGFADCLMGEERNILTLQPGITGPASIKYKDEELILEKQDNPEKYNREIIWPDKVQINLEYMKDWSLKQDVWYIIKTIIG
jgi:lipopolysaccharide/colanic/teichoic acid biosynthesis glycosyltransferase